MSKKVFKDKALQDQLKVNIKHILKKRIFKQKLFCTEMFYFQLYKHDLHDLCSYTRPVFYKRIFKYYVDICYSFYRINCQALSVEI